MPPELFTHLLDDRAQVSCLMHAKDETATRWYEQFDFDPSPSDPLHLFPVMKDLKRLIAATAHTCASATDNLLLFWPLEART
jgi:hypothetical protein